MLHIHKHILNNKIIIHTILLNHRILLTIILQETLGFNNIG